MTTHQPFSLRIFVADGDPDGLRLVERSNWIGKALVFPRKLYPEVRIRSEFQQTGVLARNVYASSDGWCTALRGRSREQYFPTSGLVRTANGRIEWKRADGRTLKQLQEAQAAE